MKLKNHLNYLFFLVLGLLVFSTLGFADEDDSITGDTLDCSDIRYVFCDDFEGPFDDTKWHNSAIGGNCTEQSNHISCSETNSGTDAASLYWQSTHKTLNNLTSFCVEWSMNRSAIDGNEEAFGIQTLGWASSGKFADTFNAGQFDTRLDAGDNKFLFSIQTEALYKHRACYNTSDLNYYWLMANATTDAILNGTNRSSDAIVNNSGWWALNNLNVKANYYYMVAWNGTSESAPYLTAAVVAISNSSWNVTSGNVINNETAWLEIPSKDVNLSSDLLSFTVNASENTNMSCSRENDINYTSMVALNINFKSATTDTTSHAYTLFDNLTIGSQCVFCSFIRSNGTGELANSTSGCLNTTFFHAPVDINLTTPANNSFINNTLDIDFSYLVNFPLTCILVLNSTLNQSMNSSTGSNTFPTTTLRNASYLWNVNCTNSSLSGISGTFFLNISLLIQPVTNQTGILSLEECPVDSTAEVLILILIIGIALFFLYIAFFLNIGLIGVFGTLMFMVTSWYVAPCQPLFAFIMAAFSFVLLIYFAVIVPLGFTNEVFKG